MEYWSIGKEKKSKILESSYYTITPVLQDSITPRNYLIEAGKGSTVR